MKQHFSDKKLWLLIVALILILLGFSIFHAEKCRLSMIDVVPVFVGPAAFSGDVVSVTSGETVFTPYSWMGKDVYVIPNGMAYNVTYTWNSDVLGLAPVQEGIKEFVAGTDGLVNYPAICVSYSMQDKRHEQNNNNLFFYSKL